MSDPQQYTVGWICAITTEYTAARQFLDKEHDLPTHVSANDSNGYTLGEMAGHNVVIAVLPRGTYGLSSAASVATNMLNSFPNIRVGLMVGIGGGAPTVKRDIRLGDVVVSSPENHTGGVYQYNYGKTIQGREFQQTGFLNKPPAVVLTAVSKLESTYESDGHDIEDRIKAILEKKSKLKKNYSRPAQETDCLYKSTIVHPYDSEGNSKGDCRQHCGGQPHDLVQRREREEDEDNPSIHYGIVASADQLMKDATMRDSLADEKGILCFEMEAAGLMYGFPCLVVRGICDYADSHKSKEWQGYAAMTAAAYSRDLLAKMVPTRVANEAKLLDLLGVNMININENLANANNLATEYITIQKTNYQDDKHRQCHQALKTSTYEQFKNINPDRVEQTCQWVLTHPLYRRWKDAVHDDLLWISADPGCGKSVLSKALVDDELRRNADGNTVCYFFFKDNDKQNSLATALCALLHQLFQHQPHLLHHALPAWNKDGSKLPQEIDELWRILLAATSDVAACNTTCLLDALDECKDNDRSNLIAKLSRFYETAASQSGRRSWLKFVVTSRPYDNIQRDFHHIHSSLPAIRLRGEEENDQIRTEINRVIEIRVSQLKDEIRFEEGLHARLTKKLLMMEHRTYLWLHLAIDAIRTSLRSPRPNEEAIESVPSSVEEAYTDILKRVPKERQDDAKIILQIIVGARRPLTVAEMALAFGVATDKTERRTSNDFGIDPGHLETHLRYWCGLFVFINDSRIYLIHQTAREFLVARQDSNDTQHWTNGSWRHCIQQAQVEQMMAVICMRCINLEDREALCGDVRSLGGENRDNDFVGYCCEWWTIHYRSFENAADQDAFRLALKLYELRSQTFEFWFHRFWSRTQDQPSIPSMTGIQLAAFSSHNDILKHYLQMPKSDLETVDSSGRTALAWACAEGHDRTVRMILDAGADVNPGYYNALRAASARGRSKISQLLLDRGADIIAKGGFYGSALQAASERGHNKIVQLLLDRGADINAKGGLCGSALQAASERGHNKIVQLLLDRGADINAKGGFYGSALQAASAEGHDEVVQLLLDRGADINAKGGVYGSALRAALAKGYDEVVQLLLDRGADDNVNALQAALVRRLQSGVADAAPQW